MTTTCVATTVAASTSTIVASASPALSTQTISASSMPPGWSLEDNADTGVGCLHNLLEPAGIKQTSAAETYYAYAGGIPFLDEKVATYSNAKEAFTKIARTIAACHHPSGPFKGYQTTGTVTPLAYAKVGSQSVAYHMVFTTSTNVTIYYDYVIARKKKVIVAVLEGSYPAVSASQFGGFVTLALSHVTS
ncbi:MAG: hypothetical protein WCF63_01850 [Acidimicrobiales bacterium]